MPSSVSSRGEHHAAHCQPAGPLARAGPSTGAHTVAQAVDYPVDQGSLLARVLAGAPPGESPLTHVATLPGRAADTVDWPDWVAPPVVAAFAEQGVHRPWTHQAKAGSLAWSGHHVVVATGTASGKSLGYQLPVLSALLNDRKATALYLSPTKALGADQLRVIESLGLDDLAGYEGIRAEAFDGDTPREQRDWVRAHSRWVFSNPDMLHRSVLPRHGRWASFLRRLRYVVLDECHAYRGVFGSHVALLLRRLRRLCSRYGSSPTFVLASATVADPAESAARLTGLDVVAVTEDGSPRGPRTVALWEPPLLEELRGENGAPVRRSSGAEAGRMLADLVVEGARTLAFVRSRVGAETVALRAARALAEVDPELAQRVSAYRAGFLPEERRALERALESGELLGVASTNALELGVDIVGLDVVLIAGFPGTRASFWQQAGRAGRAGRPALVVLVARDDPLDTYLVHHPEALLGRPVEGCVLDPTNPYVLGPQLACAAAESPLTDDEVGPPPDRPPTREAPRAHQAPPAHEAAPAHQAPPAHQTPPAHEAAPARAIESPPPVFGGPRTHSVLDALVADGVLRRRPAGWFWARHDDWPSASVDIRGGGGGQVAVVEGHTGRLLGTVDWAQAPASVHPGAVYLHRGASFVVDQLDLDEGVALVHAEEPDWSTSARTVVDVAVLEDSTDRDSHRAGGVVAQLGVVLVTSQVVSYLRRRPSGEVIETVQLDMPEQSLHTRAVWYTIDESLLADAGLDAARIPGALHAAEHAAIGLLPLFAVCDRWDIGGMSTALHPDTGAPTVFVHDGHPGGAGFAERGYADLLPWLRATREAIASCECPSGCPSCVQSPKCGNGNNPLDKGGAVTVLDIVVGALGREPAGTRGSVGGVTD